MTGHAIPPTSNTRPALSRPVTVLDADPRCGSTCACGKTTFKDLARHGLKPLEGWTYCIFGYCPRPSP